MNQLATYGELIASTSVNAPTMPFSTNIKAFPMKKITIDGKEIKIRGTLIKSASVGADGYEFIHEPSSAIEVLKAESKADIFTFREPLSSTDSPRGYYHEFEGLAVLPITDYETWWKKQINDKTRNMVRKAGKKGVIIKVVPFDDTLVTGIEAIHNEHPMRQGRPFKHYGKPFNQVKEDHESFLERSDFIGAFYNEELIGFIKLVHSEGWSSLMQIISKMAHRDKAPTNGLLAKAVEICADRGVKKLQYGSWSTRGIGDFKLHHAFEKVDVRRYYVPLTTMGKLALRLKLHRELPKVLPERFTSFLMDVRTRLYNFKYRRYTIKGAVA